MSELKNRLMEIENIKQIFACECGECIEDRKKFRKIIKDFTKFGRKKK